MCKTKRVMRTNTHCILLTWLCVHRLHSPRVEIPFFDLIKRPYGLVASLLAPHFAPSFSIPSSFQYLFSPYLPWDWLEERESTVLFLPIEGGVFLFIQSQVRWISKWAELGVSTIREHWNLTLTLVGCSIVKSEVNRKEWKWVLTLW